MYQQGGALSSRWFTNLPDGKFPCTLSCQSLTKVQEPQAVRVKACCCYNVDSAAVCWNCSKNPWGHLCDVIASDPACALHGSYAKEMYQHQRGTHQFCILSVPEIQDLICRCENECCPCASKMSSQWFLQERSGRDLTTSLSSKMMKLNITQEHSSLWTVFGDIGADVAQPRWETISQQVKLYLTKPVMHRNAGPLVWRKIASKHVFPDVVILAGT